MVIYKPFSDINDIKNLFTDLTVDEGCQYGAYKAFQGDEYCGCCLVRIDGYNCYVSHIDSVEEDAELVEGLIRSALNYAANRSAYIANCCEEQYKSVLELLGFEKNGVSYSGDIPTLLQGACCKGK